MAASTRHRAGAGALAGLASAVLVLVLPVVGAVILLGTMGVLAARPVLDWPNRTRHLAAASGFCAAAGLLLLIVAGGVVTSCSGTDGACGNANPVPLAIAGTTFTVVAIVAGTLAARLR